jgi:tetrahydromethanopterin S-methyltransferase subunit E
MSSGDGPEGREAAVAAGDPVAAGERGDAGGAVSSAIFARLLIAVLALGAGIAALVVAITLVRSALG